MKEMKRILSLVLCFVMLVGMMPAIALNADAAEGDHYLMFATDRHANTSVIGEIINNMESAIGENQLEYLGLGGDMVGSGNNHPTYNSSTVLAEATNATSSLNASNVDIVAGIHDMNVNDDAGIVLPYQRGGAQIYEGDDYYVYGVEEYCISEDSDENNWDAQAQAFQDWALGDTIDTSKAIFVVSHYPLHAKRDDNDGAMYWHQALNTVATGTAEGDGTVERDIVFFHGHNHTEDSNEYVYTVGDTMEIQNGSSTVSGTIYYTYATAGYLNQNKKATLVTLTDDAIVLTKYSTSGSGTAMATVKRYVTEETKTIKNVVLNDGTSGTYVVGDPGILFNLVVTYSDGSTETVTQDVCVIESVEDALTGETVDYAAAMQTPGEYAAIVSYQGVTCGNKVYFTVSESGDSNYDLLNLIINGAEVAADVKDVTADETVVAAMGTLEGIDEFVAYDITATLAEGETATVSIPVPAEWVVGELNALYIDGEGNVTDETFEVTYADGYATFAVTHFSTYAVTNTAVTPADGTATVPGSSTTTKVAEDVTVYKLVTTPESGKSYLIVNSANGTGYGLDGDTTGYATSAFTGGADYYSAWDNASQSGTAFSAGSDVYLTTEGAYLWTAGSNTFAIGYSQSSDGSFLGGYTYSYTLNPSGSGDNWTLSDSKLYITLETSASGILGGSDASSAFYLSNSGETWSMGSTGSNVYFYEPVTIYKVTETTTGTQEATYGVNITVNGTAASTMTANNVVSGDTLQLGAEFTSTVAGQEPSGGTWNITSSNTGVATVDNNGLVTFTGVAGETVIRAEYTWTVNGNSYTIYNTLTITTTAMSYSMNIVEETATVKIGATQELTLETKDSEGNAVTAEDVTWTSSDAEVATVEGGVVTGVAAGDATITAEWTDPAGVKRTDTAVISVVDAVYTLDITSDGSVVTGTTIAKKGVTASTTLQLGTKVYADGTEIAVPANATIAWNIPEEYQNIATVGHDTGLVTFKGEDGAFYVTATLTVNGKDYTVGVNISATTSQYSVPSDGASDFPEYPNEGAIRYDKTATAVGNFSQTGIAQVELSMTGVPYNEGSEIDVVIMLDMSTSMDDTRIAATVAATKVFIDSIVKNADGTYNGNRIYVGYFNGDTVYTITDSANIGGELESVDSDTEYNQLISNIESEYDGSKTASGTNYDVSLEKCYNVLNTAKTDGTGNDRKQFCVFMSDGGPTDYATSASNVIAESSIVGYFEVGTAGSTTVDPADYTNTVPAEYWSGLMKTNGVTIYSVGLILQEQPSSGPQTYRKYTDDQYYYITKTLLTGISSGEDYFFNCESSTDTAEMEDIFADIAVKILQAATDVTVEDKISDDYTMIFDIPEGSKDISGVTNDFYIEFGKYALDENHERTTFTSVTKLYLENTDGVLSAKDATDPVFEQKVIGEKGSLYYWSTNAADGDAGISVEVDGTTYYFVSYGMEEAGYNMTSGAYANGTVDPATNMSENLVIATPYFVYDAATKMLYWTVDKLDTEEYVLRYFLYLDNSATEVGTSKETDPGSYQTNEHAYITYTNFKGHDCRQTFPVPQLTWNGAQVSYVFYLVNSAGQPINKSGQVVDFANATFITDVYTESVVWNKEGDTSTGTGQLSADWLADDLLPDEYEIYDEQARYVLNVYENADGSTIKNQFTISGDTAANISSSLNTRLKLDTTASTVSIGTTKVYNTKAGEKISAYGTYTSADSDMDDFDFANTTVAFAVVWQPRLVEDTVVVDYGLDVIINVVQNDILQNTVSGIGLGNSAYGNIAMNTGVSTTSKLGTAALTIDGNTISIENETSVRFSQNDMEFNKSVTFYYETPVEFWEGSHPTEGYMYSSVTVIPATTIYYEDEFVDLKTYVKQEDGTYKEGEGWKVSSTSASATQQQDRPGESLISGTIDADNNYGYDAAYTAMSTHSMNGAAMASVKAGTYATAEFTFYGTGFDVISMTSNTTGTLTVKVVAAQDINAADGTTIASGTAVKNMVVDTYYGYTRDAEGNWVVTPDKENALYQVPVIKAEGLTYGKYTVTITASYVEFFDHTTPEGYDLYLDAIRIYDPANDGATDEKVEDAYVADGEGWPSYIELRNKLIKAETFNQATNAVVGEVFIDGDASVGSAEIADYTSYGPNNELYLASGQSIAFELGNLDLVAKIQLGIKSADGSAVTYTIQNITSDGTVSNAKTATISTTTDMYYDITGWKDGIIVITNSGDAGIISLTNIKATYTVNPNAEVVASEDDTEDVPSDTNEVYTYMTPAAATMTLRALNAPAVVEPEETEPETTEPETTEPETTEPETTEPETTEPETTEPETTEPETTEPETTEPENTEPEEKPSEEEVVREIVKGIIKIFGRLFGRWF